MHKRTDLCVHSHLTSAGLSLLLPAAQDLLHRPAEGLLMNQSDVLGETKMQNEFLTGLRPLIHSTHVWNTFFLPCSVSRRLSEFVTLLQSPVCESNGMSLMSQGTQFWNLPQHYGDEISGITATLTRTEQGRQKPLTYAGQPRSIRLEKGIQRDLRSGSYHLVVCSIPANSTLTYW